jgi:hypothetical protein
MAMPALSGPRSVMQDQHFGQQGAELRFQRLVLQKQSYNSAHPGFLT